MLKIHGHCCQIGKMVLSPNIPNQNMPNIFLQTNTLVSDYLRHQTNDDILKETVNINQSLLRCELNAFENLAPTVYHE